MYPVLQQVQQPPQTSAFTHDPIPGQQALQPFPPLSPPSICLSYSARRSIELMAFTRSFVHDEGLAGAPLGVQADHKQCFDLLHYHVCEFLGVEARADQVLADLVILLKSCRRCDRKCCVADSRTVLATSSASESFTAFNIFSAPSTKNLFFNSLPRNLFTSSTNSKIAKARALRGTTKPFEFFECATAPYRISESLKAPNLLPLTILLPYRLPVLELQ